ncbi:hypothetical protein FF38_07839, partial [Lucilia cuprina]
LSKQPLSFGDEPDLFIRAQGRNSLHFISGIAAANTAAPTTTTTTTSIPLINASTGKINLETSINDCETGYVPTVGRWGAEWPMSHHQGATAVGANHGLSAGSVRVGLTTAIDSEQDKPKILHCIDAAGKLCSNGQLQNNSDSTTDDDDDDDYEDDDDEDDNDLAFGGAGKEQLNTETVKVAEPKDINLTSNPSSERCISVNKLLEEQHRRWWGRLFGGSAPNAEETCGRLWQGDGYNMSAFNQTNGNWPLGHPLPLPDWLPYDEEDHQKGILHLDSVWQFEDLSAIIESKLQPMLDETHYDTVHLFVDFYKAFKRTRRSDLKSFYQFYDIPINRRHHMCVSLAMEIMSRIVEIFPILEHYLYIVSCEEQVISLRDYIETSEELGGLNSPLANVEKEHAMVAMKLNIAGRNGVIILDPGYHVARCVTVMEDQMYPHT